VTAATHPHQPTSYRLLAHFADALDAPVQHLLGEIIARFDLGTSDGFDAALEELRSRRGEIIGALADAQRCAFDDVRTDDLQHHCRACTRMVAGTDQDRLRTGFCAACYRAWARAGRPSGAALREWIQRRPLRGVSPPPR